MGIGVEPYDDKPQHAAHLRIKIYKWSHGVSFRVSSHQKSCSASCLLLCLPRSICKFALSRIRVSSVGAGEHLVR